MTYRGNQPLLAVAMAPYSAVANAGQTYFPIPGGVVPGLNIVGVGGALLSPGDFDDSDGLGILLAQPVAAGTQFQLYAMGYNTSYVPVGGQLAPFRNKFRNGNFDIWQRGASVVTGNNYQAGNAAGYGPDGWWMQVYAGSSGTGTSSCSMTQQAFALGQTAVPGEPAYYARFQPASIGGQGGTGSIIQAVHRIEGVRTFAGQRVTLSGFAGADTTRTYALQVIQNFGTGGSPSANVVAYEQLLPVIGSLARQQISFDMPSIAGKTLGTGGNDHIIVAVVLYKQDNLTTGGSLGAVGTWSATPRLDMARWQIEVGSVATDFEGRHIQKELALAQRYYRRVVGASGSFTSASNATVGVQMAGNPMRAAPTAAASGTSQLVDPGLAFYTVSAVAVNSLGALGGYMDLTVSGATAGHTAIVSNAAGYIELSSEL